MRGFFQTPDPNPNHTVRWATLRVTRLRVNRRIVYDQIKSKILINHSKYTKYIIYNITTNGT